MIPHLDHLVFAAQDLETGIAHIERLTGVRAVLGGRHPSFGTHNALLGLGPHAYLEIMAPDPSLPAPARGRLTDGWGLESPRLVTWVVRPPDIAEAATTAASCGIELGKVRPCSRLTPDGTTLRWRLSDPYSPRLSGAVPFLIDWGATPHPAETARVGLSLEGFRIEHPAADTVNEVLESLHAGELCTRNDNVRLVARVRSPKGLVELA
jgi:Glyoxalase-like domain